MSFLSLGITSSTSNRASLESTAPTVGSLDDDEGAYWEDSDWIPVLKSGKQRSPNMIRNELQRYLDKTAGLTQTALCRELGVNGNSFSKFMNPKTYKDPWSACQNGTYWAAARFLEAQRNKPKATSSGKRKAAPGDSAGPAKKSKAQAKSEAVDLMNRIVAVQGPVSDRVVYDSCPELIKKCKEFLAMDGVTKAGFCRTALGGINANSLGPFLMSKKQDKAGCIAYPRAWVFFEKKRLMEGKSKTKARIKNEGEHPSGFTLEGPRAFKWVICAR